MFPRQIKETLVPPSLYTLIKENLRECNAKDFMHSISLVSSLKSNASSYRKQFPWIYINKFHAYLYHWYLPLRIMPHHIESNALGCVCVCV